MPESKQKMPKHVSWIALASIVLIVAALVAIVLATAGTEGKFYVSGDPINIKLVGVLPDGSDDLYDAEGKLVGTMVVNSTMSLGGADDGTERLCRDFIFELPTEESLLFVPSPLLKANGQCHLGGTVYGPLLTDIGGKRSLRQNRSFPSTYRKPFLGGFLFHEMEVDRVDLTFRFFKGGRRGPAELSFTGPFTPDRPCQADGGRAGTLTPSYSYRYTDERAEFHLDTPLRCGSSDILVLAYDNDGKRHLAHSGSGSWGMSGVQADYSIEGLGFSDIAALTVNEKPCEKTFHNIRVRYPDRPARAYPAYLDAMAERLNLNSTDGQYLCKYKIDTLDNAVQVIDVVRGEKLRQAFDQIDRAKANDIAAEDLARVERAANLLLSSSDWTLRTYGARLGLWLDPNRYIIRALSVLEELPANSLNTRFFLNKYIGHLNSESLGAVADTIAGIEDEETARRIARSLQSADQEAARDACLRLALDPRPYVWWPAISKLPTDWRPDARDIDMWARVYLVRGWVELPQKEALVEKAGSMLGEIFMPHTAMHHGFELDSFVKRFGQEAVEHALKGYLNEAVAGKAKWYYVRKVVKHVNRWHQIDIAGLGKDPNDEREYGYNYLVVAADALEYLRTGQLPTTPAPQRKPQKGDVRIVWKNNDDPGKSLYAIWYAPPDGSDTRRYIRLRQGEDMLFCRLAATAGGDYIYDVGAYEPGQQSRSSNSIPSAKMPCQVYSGTGWECWLEPAESDVTVFPGGKLPAAEAVKEPATAQ